MLGTPALTSRGFLEEDFAKVAHFFDAAVQIALKIKAETKGLVTLHTASTSLTSILVFSHLKSCRNKVEGLRGHAVEPFVPIRGCKTPPRRGGVCKAVPHNWL